MHTVYLLLDREDRLNCQRCTCSDGIWKPLYWQDLSCRCNRLGIEHHNPKELGHIGRSYAG